MKCINCGADNSITIPCADDITKKYFKRESDGSPREWRQNYRIRKRLCLDCGSCFQYMDIDDLELLKAKSEYEM